jgi:hypothetical protein
MKMTAGSDTVKDGNRRDFDLEKLNSYAHGINRAGGRYIGVRRGKKIFENYEYLPAYF